MGKDNLFGGVVREGQTVGILNGERRTGSTCIVCAYITYHHTPSAAAPTKNGIIHPRPGQCSAISGLRATLQVRGPAGKVLADGGRRVGNRGRAHGELRSVFHAPTSIVDEVCRNSLSETIGRAIDVSG